MRENVDWDIPRSSSGDGLRNPQESTARVLLEVQIVSPVVLDHHLRLQLSVLGRCLLVGNRVGIVSRDGWEDWPVMEGRDWNRSQRRRTTGLWTPRLWTTPGRSGTSGHPQRSPRPWWTSPACSPWRQGRTSCSVSAASWWRAPAPRPGPRPRPSAPSPSPPLSLPRTPGEN